MNLYRSFGNLMESWVTEGGQSTAASPEDSTAYEGRISARKPTMAVGKRTESEDSGLEMASIETSRSCCSPAESPESSQSAGKADILTASSHPQSLVPSSSHSIFANQAELPSVAMHLKVEQALQRTDLLVQGHTRAHQSNGALQQRLAPVTRRRGQSTGALGPRGTWNQQVETAPGRPLSQCNVGLSAQSEACVVEERQELGPGLGYLEQVCRMLEEMARLRMIIRGLQNAMEDLREQQTKQDIQSSDFLPWDTSADRNEPSASQRLEAQDANVSSQPSGQNNSIHSNYRRRSASDSRAIMGHLRTQPVSSRGQCVSVYGIDNLFDHAEELGSGKQETKTDTQNKSNTWKFKFVSLKRGSRLTDQDSTRHSSVKRSSGHRLSQLFRRKRKTGAEGVDG